MKSIIFLDHDGVICTYGGTRFNKMKKAGIVLINNDVDVNLRFDNFDKKAIKVLNQIILETDCEIVVSSDWKLNCSLEEMGEYYINQGIIKKPIDFTPDFSKKFLSKMGENESLEFIRSCEINNWLSNNNVDKWVVVDDLDLSEKFGPISGNKLQGVKNFVHCKRGYEGIKQCGLKDKILKFLM